jgi:hypothetical protein
VRSLQAGALYFAIIFAAGFALGTLRTLFLAPKVGSAVAVAIELPVMLAVAWFVCRRVATGWALEPNIAARLLMGGSALVLLIISETVLGLLLGRSLAELVAEYGTPAGLLGVAGQIAAGSFPVAQGASDRLSRRVTNIQMKGGMS